ncbi:MAG: ABC transporter permease, partial [Parasporobacterium sp.]|nr:ABC transporter permease [Parasporobacterium sp.]
QGLIMNRTLQFAKRNLIEMARDVLSYIFCIGFPILMLAVMTLVNESIPEDAGMTIFRIDSLSGGIAIFGQTFVMLFTALMVSKDRTASFLIRLYASPMKSRDFTNGYMLPMLVISAMQALLAFAVSLVISRIVGYDLKLPGLLAGLAVLIPSAVFFISIGLICGTLFNDKAAPGICSLIISLGSFLGGIWFDAEAAGGVILKISRCLPFIYCTKSIRAAIRLDFGKENFLIPLLVVTAAAALSAILASLLFRTKMKADLA